MAKIDLIQTIDFLLLQPHNKILTKHNARTYRVTHFNHIDNMWSDVIDEFNLLFLLFFPIGFSQGKLRNQRSRTSIYNYMRQK